VVLIFVASLSPAHSIRAAVKASQVGFATPQHVGPMTDPATSLIGSPWGNLTKRNTFLVGSNAMRRTNGKGLAVLKMDDGFLDQDAGSGSLESNMMLVDSI
jgi:hypothetical protein